MTGTPAMATIGFTDVVGSTELRGALGEEPAGPSRGTSVRMGLSAGDGAPAWATPVQDLLRLAALAGLRPLRRFQHASEASVLQCGSWSRRIMVCGVLLATLHLDQSEPNESCPQHV